MSSNILPTSGAINITDMRLLDNGMVHLSGNETISGQKTFNNILNTLQGITNSGLLTTNGITNTGDITTSGNLLTSSGKKYIRLLNISNYNTVYNISTVTINTTPYNKIDLATIIKSSLTNTFLSITNGDCVFNEIGDYYICVNIIYSIDTTLIKKININFSFDGSKSIIDQDVNLFNFKYQNDLSQIYNIITIDNPNTQYLRLYVQCSDSITLTIHKINIDIIKLN